MEKRVDIIGGGLAGSEAALQLAADGFAVRLIEMRPFRTTGAHHGDKCAELVCSNSLKSTKEASAAGMLKAELELLGSHLLAFAHESSVPAGGALAVDREQFASLVTDALVQAGVARIEAEVVGIDTSAEAIDLVLSGRADFLGISVPVLNAYLDEHPDAADKLKAAFVIPNSEDVIAIPVRKGEPEFLDAINAALAELREEGTLKEISEKYLGGDYTNSAYSN